MRRLIIFLLTLVCLCSLILLRWHGGHPSPSASMPSGTLPVVSEPAENYTPSPSPSSVPEKAPSSSEPDRELPSSAAPVMHPASSGYTEASYQLVSDMVYAYASGSENWDEVVQKDLDELNRMDPALGHLWSRLMSLWSYVNTDFEPNAGLLPDGLPDDASLCIVVLGFQLEPDGSMSRELLGRCETALQCAEKYPHAMIAVTGGGTARQNPDATEAGVMASWLTAHGIAPDRIVLEDASLTTADNAVFTCALLRDHYPEVQYLAIVSSDYHLPLGVLLFQAQAFLYEYETGQPSFFVISNAAFAAESHRPFSSPSFQKSYLWSLTDPHY